LYVRTREAARVSSQDITADRLALLYIVFAMGSYYNLELPPDDSSVEEYLELSRSCLAKGDFLANNTIAALQTLVGTLVLGDESLTQETAHHGASATVSGIISASSQTMLTSFDLQKHGLGAQRRLVLAALGRHHAHGPGYGPASGR
jgi:hypothetical protein